MGLGFMGLGFLRFRALNAPIYPDRSCPGNHRGLNNYNGFWGLLIRIIV